MSETTIAEASGESARAKPRNRITVYVRHAGLQVTVEVNIHQKVRKILEDALAAFAEQGLRPPDNADVVLRLGDRDLDPEASIEDAGIEDQTELDLVFNTRAG